LQPEPIRDMAHLGHVEVFTPKFDESVKFFVDVMGMTQSGEKGDSVYLRGWDDYERYSLKLTAAKTSGMGHAAFRTRSPQALERRAAALKGSGFDVGWSDGDLGHGKTFVCKDPDGHVIELYYDTEWYNPPLDQKPALKNQAQRYPARGINVRRIDHFNGLAVDIKANREFFQNYLGFMLTDRKSTRLNSSHLGISYAVFCLKNKKSFTAGWLPGLSVFSPAGVTWLKVVSVSTELFFFF